MFNLVFTLPTDLARTTECYSTSSLYLCQLVCPPLLAAVAPAELNSITLKKRLNSDLHAMQRDSNAHAPYCQSFFLCWQRPMCAAWAVDCSQ